MLLYSFKSIFPSFTFVVTSKVPFKVFLPKKPNLRSLGCVVALVKFLLIVYDDSSDKLIENSVRAVNEVAKPFCQLLALLCMPHASSFGSIEHSPRNVCCHKSSTCIKFTSRSIQPPFLISAPHPLLSPRFHEWNTCRSQQDNFTCKLCIV